MIIALASFCQAGQAYSVSDNSLCINRYDFRVEESEMSSLLEDFGGDLTLPENFEKTVTPYDGTSDKKKGKQPQCQVNFISIVGFVLV